MHDINNAPCLYFCTADDGTLLSVNETLCSKLGFIQSELTGKKTDIIFPIATRIFQQTHLFPLLKMQLYANEIFVMLHSKNKDQVPVLLNAERKIINGQTVTIYAGIIVNNRKKFEDELIAAKKLAEAALQENSALNAAKQQLQQHVEQMDEQMQLIAKQNEELRQFNQGITHDLQEPLRKLSVFTDILLDRDYSNNLQENLKKLKRVVEQTRSVMSGLQQYIWLSSNLNKTNAVDLKEIVLAACQQLQQQFPDVIINIQQNLPEITADEEQIKLLFYHLLLNAIQFRKSGNEVHIKITTEKLLLNKFKQVKDKYHYKEFLKVELTDDGIGFTAENEAEVFELFKRLHKQSGRGIGLALCKKIVDNHGGEISITSLENVGTTVTVILPLHDNE